MKNLQINQELTQLFRQHPALLVSLVYVIASSIGMFYARSYIGQFGINVFHYAQIGDFLLASLKEPVTWLLSIAAVLAVSLDSAMSRRCEKKGPPRWLKWYGNRYYRSINVFIAIAAIVGLLFGYSIYQANQNFAGNGKNITVQISGQTTPTSRQLLGTTGQFIFLFDANSRKVSIHPNEAIESLSFITPKR